MSIWLIGAVVALVYPTMAGITYRLLSGMDTTPPEPATCGCHGLRQSGLGPCQDASEQPYVHITMKYRSLYCDQCNDWIDWAVLHKDDDRHPLVLAWLWPLYPLYAVPRRLFLAGANVTAHPKVQPVPEREEVTP